jgi:hypothetical protein
MLQCGNGIASTRFRPLASLMIRQTRKENHIRGALSAVRRRKKILTARRP